MKKLIMLASIASLALAADIEVINPWVKITPPNAKNSAMFMSIKNNTNKDIRLIGATSDLSKTAEIHNHIHENGMMKMVRIKDALIPAGGALELKPKSFHVMLMGLNGPISEQTLANAELEFDNNEKVKITNVPAKAVVGMHNHHDHHSAHEGHGAHDHHGAHEGHAH